MITKEHIPSVSNKQNQAYSALKFIDAGTLIELRDRKSKKYPPL